MRKLGRIWGLLLLCLLLPATQAVFKPQPATAQDPAAEIFRLVNQFRAEIGLPPFVYNAQLAAAAREQANFIAVNNVYSHTGTNGSRPQDRATSAGYNGYVIENIVGGTNMTPQQGLIWWQNSPVHYNTLVSTRHTQAGTGYAFGNGQHRYALVVGRPANQPVSSSAVVDSSPAPIIIIPIELAEPAEDGSITHVIGEGQALWTIAAYYEVPIADLLLFNNLADNAFLQPGDSITIRLADGQAPPPTPTPPPVHTVAEGQTLWTIAAIHNISLADLLWYNGLPEDAFIQPGDELVVRLEAGQSPPPTATPQMTYFVAAGDTLWSIAARHSISIEELLGFNQLPADVILQPGDELWIRDPLAVLPTPDAEPTAALSAASLTPTILVDQPTANPALPTSAVVTTTPIPSITQTPDEVAQLFDDPADDLAVVNDSRVEAPSQSGPSRSFWAAAIAVFLAAVVGIWVYQKREI